jgi:hypothetical protein
MPNQDQVKKIIDYLQAKISNLKEKLKQYDTPIMQEMAKNSPHLQMDYIRLTTELQANEENLLAIQNFYTEPENKPTVKEKSKPKKSARQKPPPPNAENR